MKNKKSKYVPGKYPPITYKEYYKKYWELKCPNVLSGVFGGLSCGFVLLSIANIVFEQTKMSKLAIILPTIIYMIVQFAIGLTLAFSLKIRKKSKLITMRVLLIVFLILNFVFTFCLLSTLKFGYALISTNIALAIIGFIIVKHLYPTPRSSSSNSSDSPESGLKIIHFKGKTHIASVYGDNVDIL